MLHLKHVVLVVLCFQQITLADELGSKTKPLIHWYVEDKQENADIFSANDEQTPTATYIEKIITIRLKKDFDIRFERVSMSRINYALSNTDNSCAANRAFNEERASYSIFSKPQAFYLTHRLYRYNQLSPFPAGLLNEQNEVLNLANVFEHFPKAKLGIAENVSFGEFIDTQIADIPDKNLYLRSGNNRVTALEAMLYSGRVDYLIALSVDIKPSESQASLLEKYRIAGAPKYISAYFNCSDSYLGHKLITKLNELLNDLYMTEEYYRSHRNTFSERELIELQRYVNKHYGSEQMLLSH